MGHLQLQTLEFFGGIGGGQGGSGVHFVYSLYSSIQFNQIEIQFINQILLMWSIKSVWFVFLSWTDEYNACGGSSV